MQDLEGNAKRAGFSSLFTPLEVAKAVPFVVRNGEVFCQKM